MIDPAEINNAKIDIESCAMIERSKENTNLWMPMAISDQLSPYGHELFVLYPNPRPLYKGLVETNYGFQ